MTYYKRHLSTRLGLTHNDACIYQYNYMTGADLGLKGRMGTYTPTHTDSLICKELTASRSDSNSSPLC